MARMHSRKKGKSGSTKPIVIKKKTWMNYTQQEVEQIISKLAKENPPSKIGLILRDTYGIPDIRFVLNKKLTKFLEEKNIIKTLPEDLTNLIQKHIAITKHLEKNKKDQPSKRGLILTESKIKRLVKYYKKTNRIPKDWKFDTKKAKLYLE